MIYPRKARLITENTKRYMKKSKSTSHKQISEQDCALFYTSCAWVIFSTQFTAVGIHLRKTWQIYEVFSSDVNMHKEGLFPQEYLALTKGKESIDLKMVYYSLCLLFEHFNKTSF